MDSYLKRDSILYYQVTIYLLRVFVIPELRTISQKVIKILRKVALNTTHKLLILTNAMKSKLKFTMK
jgi:hypothetical protein